MADRPSLPHEPLPETLLRNIEEFSKTDSLRSTPVGIRCRSAVLSEIRSVHHLSRLRHAHGENIPDICADDLDAPDPLLLEARKREEAEFLARRKDRPVPNMRHLAFADYNKPKDLRLASTSTGPMMIDEMHPGDCSGAKSDGLADLFPWGHLGAGLEYRVGFSMMKGEEMLERVFEGLETRERLLRGLRQED